MEKRLKIKVISGADADKVLTKYDLKTKRAYLEYPSGARRYVK